MRPKSFDEASARVRELALELSLQQTREAMAVRVLNMPLSMGTRFGFGWLDQYETELAKAKQR